MSKFAASLVFLITVTLGSYAYASEPAQKACNPKEPCVVALVIDEVMVQPPMLLFFLTEIEEAVKNKADAIIVVINSPGGDWQASEAINLLFQTADIPIHCVVDGTAASGAFWILEGCKQRAMTIESKLMTHEAAISAKPGARFTRKDLLTIAKHIEDLNLIMVKSIVQRLSITEKQYLERIGQGDWVMNPAEALEVGAVDVVVPDIKTYVKIVKSQYTKGKTNARPVPPVRVPPK